MIIMVIWWMTFGTAYYILNYNRTEENEIVPNIFNWWALDTFEYVYELGLGEFHTDSFTTSGRHGAMCYCLFLAATFLINIVFLNMLIAIMADTYAMATEQKENNARITKLKIMGDYIQLIRDVVNDEIERTA